MTLKTFHLVKIQIFSVVGDDVMMETVLPVEDFQVLSGEQQSEEIFRLLSMLSPFAGEVSGLKTSIDTALTRIR